MPWPPKRAAGCLLPCLGLPSGQRVASRQRHVVRLVDALPVLPDPELDLLDLLHAPRLLAARVHLCHLAADLLGNARVHSVAVIEQNVAIALRGLVELEGPSVAKLLAANE